MATGTLPFRGDTPGVIFHAILEYAPDPAGRINPKLPHKLQEIFDKCFEKDRELRCQSAAELRADLKRAQRDIASDAASDSVQRLSAQAAPATDSRSQGFSLPVSASVPGAEVRRRGRTVGIIATLLVVLLAAGILGHKLLNPSAPPIDTHDITIRQLTDHQHVVDSGAAVSADGKLIAYARRTPGKAKELRLSASLRALAPESKLSVPWPVRSSLKGCTALGPNWKTVLPGSRKRKRQMLRKTARSTRRRPLSPRLVWWDRPSSPEIRDRCRFRRCSRKSLSGFPPR
jgi:serine/threonine protein kinase